MNWYYQTLNPEAGEALAEVKKSNVAMLPIRSMDFANKIHSSRHDRIVKLAEQLIALRKRLKTSRTSHETTALGRQIESTEAQMDGLVYEVYGLTSKQIQIVEDSRPAKRSK